ncbi:MAG: sterol desaturase [Leptospiraceae bacterium]|nr:MAG: sterol desaturase [Leptospiraceae bacterium]
MEYIQGEINVNIGVVFFTITIINLLRYILIAGAAFLIFWIFLKDKIYFRRIQKREPKRSDYKREILYSMSTILIFGIVGVIVYYLRIHGYTKIYSDVNQYGWGYFWFSVIALIFLHDTYFYWTHRWMHHPKIFKYVHLVHHKSNNPTPFAAYSFHPLEAVVEAGIVPLAVFIMPVHTGALFIFITFSFVMNVLGHIGYEFYFKGFTKHPLTWWNNTSTHHNMHHKYVNWNFGLYFNIWDRLMGTNHPRYHEIYNEITQIPLLAKHKDTKENIGLAQEI